MADATSDAPAALAGSSTDETPTKKPKSDSSSPPEPGSSSGTTATTTTSNSNDTDTNNNAPFPVFGFSPFGQARGGMRQQFETLLAGISSESPSEQLQSLLVLCETLSLASDDSLAGFRAKAFVEPLVRLLGADYNPDAMLLSARVLTHLMDAIPNTVGLVVQAQAVPILCSHLLNISYIDLAEQALQALDKIANESPQTILHAGGLVAVLTFLDFFPIGVQRSAVRIASAVCRRIPLQNFGLVRDAIPILTNLLQYSDAELVSNASLALLRLVDSFRDDADNLQTIASFGLLDHIARLLQPSSQTSLGTQQQLLRMLTTLTSASVTITEQILIDMAGASLLSELLTVYSGFATSSNNDTPTSSANNSLVLDSPADYHSGTPEHLGTSSFLHGSGSGRRSVSQPNVQQLTELLRLINQILPNIDSTSSDDSEDSPFGDIPAGSSVTRLYLQSEHDRPVVGSGNSGDLFGLNAPSRVRRVIRLGVHDETKPKPEKSDESDNGDEEKDGTVADQEKERSTTKSPEVDKRRELFAATHPQLAATLCDELLDDLLELCSSTSSAGVRFVALSNITKLIHLVSPSDANSALQNVSISSFVATLLESKDVSLNVAAIPLAKLLMSKLPDVFKVYFVREGVEFELSKLRAEHLANEANREDEDSDDVGSAIAAAPSSPSPVPSPEDALSVFQRVFGGLARGDLGEAGRHLQQRVAETQRESQRQQTQRDRNARRWVCRAAAKFYELHFGGSGSSSSSSSSTSSTLSSLKSTATGKVSASAMLEKLCVIAESLRKQSAGEFDSDISADLLKQIVAIVSGDELGGVSSFELLRSRLSDALLHFLTNDGSDERSSRLERVREFARLFMTAPSDSCPNSPFALLVEMLVRTLHKIESVPVHVTDVNLDDPTESAKLLRAPFKFRLQLDPSYTNRLSADESDEDDSESDEEKDKAKNAENDVLSGVLSSPSAPSLPPLRDYSSSVVLVGPLSSVAAVREFLLNRVLGDVPDDDDEAASSKKTTPQPESSSSTAPESEMPPPPKSFAEMFGERDGETAESSKTKQKKATNFKATQKKTKKVSRRGTGVTMVNKSRTDSDSESSDDDDDDDDDEDSESDSESVDGNVVPVQDHVEDVLGDVNDHDDDNEHSLSDEDEPPLTASGVLQLEQFFGSSGSQESQGAGASPQTSSTNDEAASTSSSSSTPSAPSSSASRSSRVQLRFPGFKFDHRDTDATVEERRFVRRQQNSGELSASSAQSDVPQLHSLQLELSLNGHVLSDDMTVLSAIREFQVGEVGGEMTRALSARRMWSTIYTLRYRMVTVEPIDERPSCESHSQASTVAGRSSSSSSSHTATGAVVPSLFESNGGADTVAPAIVTRLGLRSSLDKRLALWSSVRLFDSDVSSIVTSADGQSREQCDTLLSLLSVLSLLNTHAPVAFAQDEVYPARVSTFVSGKLTGKVVQQVRDPLTVCSSNPPSWISALVRDCPFLIPFDVRRLFLRTSAFGLARALLELQRLEQFADATNQRQARVASSQTQKVRINRRRALESAVRVMELYAKSRVVLEVEYFGESGTGLGPTMEFYTLVSKQLLRERFPLWRVDRTSETTKGGFVHPKGGIFPRSLRANDFNRELVASVSDFMCFVGCFIGRALADNRLVDLPFSRPLLRAMVGDQLGLVDVADIAPEVYVTLVRLWELHETALGCGVDAAALASLTREEQVSKGLAYDTSGSIVEDLGLTFVHPDDHSWELAPGGSDLTVTISNAGRYVALVVDALVGSGVQIPLEALRTGLAKVFEPTTLRGFEANELEALLCGEGETHDEYWTRDALADAMRCDHGYVLGTPAIQMLLEVLTSFSHSERRSFLTFVTGAPSLPVGGFAALRPRLTVVLKHSGDGHAPDEILPSVMTCANYLKWPSYTTVDVARSRLLLAICEGQGGFLMS